MKYAGRFFYILMLLAFLPATLTAFDANFNFSVTQVTDKTGAIAVNASVSPGHLLYRNQMSFSAAAGEVEVLWPPVTVKKDPFGDGTVEVYPEGRHSFLVFFRGKTTEATLKTTLTVKYQGCSSLTCYMPTSWESEVTFSRPDKELPGTSSNAIQSASASAFPAIEAAADSNGQDAANSSAIDRPAPVQIDMAQQGIVDFSSALEKQGLSWVLLLAFLGGLLVSLTPCVYPMIPITLSIIGSRRENVSFARGLGLSATYVAGLSLTYALLGLAAATFGAQIRGFIQGTLFQGLVAVIFFLLALSMFDLIMLQIPAGLRNRLSGIKTAGLPGIFIMGMVSGLMASPCVAAPLAGILAFIAATGSQILGFFMLLLFAWGMSVPLLLIGAFSGSLNALPRAGDWMNRVKEFYGFLLLAAALYFARPLVGIAWAELGISALLASFAAFLGIFNPVNEDAGMRPKVMKSFGVVAMAVACAFAISAASQWGCLCLPKATAEKQADQAETFWQHDLQTALAEAAKSGKPLFIDFRADWCTVCRDLELNVFPQPAIRTLLDRMVPVKIDATSPDDEKVNALLKRFGIVGLPTLLILRPDGTELTALRTVGFITPENLEKKLRSAL